MLVDGVAIGYTTYGCQVTINDYSRKERDTFGNTTIIERGYTDVVTYKVEVEQSDIEMVKLHLAGCRAREVDYIGDPNNLRPELNVENALLKSFEIPIDDYGPIIITIEVESAINDAPA